MSMNAYIKNVVNGLLLFLYSIVRVLSKDAGVFSLVTSIVWSNLNM